MAERYPWVTRLHARERAPDDGPLQRPLRPLVPARARRPPRSCAFCINELRATRLAMLAIREVNPAAQLMQTEDLGQAHGTPGAGRRRSSLKTTAAG
ncbi:MAG: hypothetical protein WKG07_04695 [Hymenobacter sp.]